MQTTIVIRVTRQCKSGPNVLSMASYILVGVQAYSTGRNRFLVLKSLPCGYFQLSSLKTSNHIPAFTKLEETGKCILPYQVKERKQRSKFVSHHTQESTKFEILQELEPPVIERRTLFPSRMAKEGRVLGCSSLSKAYSSLTNHDFNGQIIMLQPASSLVFHSHFHSVTDNLISKVWVSV